MLRISEKGNFQAFCLINNFRVRDPEYSNLNAINYLASATILLLRPPCKKVALTHLDKIVPTLFMTCAQRAIHTKRQRDTNLSQENNFRIFPQHLSPKWPIWFMNISNVYHQWLKEFFYMIFDNLTSPPDKLNGCVDNLTVLPINIFNYFHCHSEKNTTWGHTVVKPRKENKTRSNWQTGQEQRLK